MTDSTTSSSPTQSSTSTSMNSQPLTPQTPPTPSTPTQTQQITITVTPPPPPAGFESITIPPLPSLTDPQLLPPPPSFISQQSTEPQQSLPNEPQKNDPSSSSSMDSHPTSLPSQFTPPPPFVSQNNTDYTDFDDMYRDDDDVTDEMLDLELLAAWGQLPSNAQVTTQYERKANEDAFTKVAQISETEGRANVKANAEVLDSLNSEPPPDAELVVPTFAAPAPNTLSKFPTRLSSESKMVCYKCGMTGHLRKDCPDAKDDDYKMSEAICYRCGLNGHISRDCKTDLRLLRVGMRCIYCGRSGHKRYNCPLLPQDAAYVPEAKRAKLGQEKEVITIDSSPEEEATKGGAQLVISDDDDDDENNSHKIQKGKRKNELKYCYNCGQKGHYGGECKKPRMDTFGEIPPPNNKRNVDWFKKVGYEERIFGPRISVNEDYGMSSLIETDPHDFHRGGGGGGGGGGGNHNHRRNSSSHNSSRSVTPQPTRNSHGGTPSRVKTPSRSPPPFSGSSSKSGRGSVGRRDSSSKGGSSAERKGGKFGSGFKRTK